MITDSEKWHYLAVKGLSVLLRGITSNHKEDIYCLICFHSYSTKNKIEKHEKVCKMLNYNHGEKSMKVPFNIYADLECLPGKIHSCQSNPKKPYTQKNICIHPLLICYLHNVQLI